MLLMTFFDIGSRIGKLSEWGGPVPTATTREHLGIYGYYLPFLTSFALSAPRFGEAFISLKVHPKLEANERTKDL